MTCTALAGAPLQDILWCAIEMAAGGPALAAVLLFILFIYALYKFNLPFEAAIPAGIAVLFVFSGAGAVASPAGGLDIFTTLMWVAVMGIGGLIGLVFWRLRK